MPFRCARTTKHIARWLAGHFTFLATTQNLFDKAIKVSKLTKIDFLSADATTARAIFPGFSSWRRLPLEASLLQKFAELVILRPLTWIRELRKPRQYP